VLKSEEFLMSESDLMFHPKRSSEGDFPCSGLVERKLAKRFKIPDLKGVPAE
jgi:hypothetical protein